MKARVKATLNGSPYISRKAEVDKRRRRE